MKHSLPKNKIKIQGYDTIKKMIVQLGPEVELPSL